MGLDGTGASPSVNCHSNGLCPAGNRHRPSHPWEVQGFWEAPARTEGSNCPDGPDQLHTPTHHPHPFLMGPGAHLSSWHDSGTDSFPPGRVGPTGDMKQPRNEIPDKLINKLISCVINCTATKRWRDSLGMDRGAKSLAAAV